MLLMQGQWRPCQDSICSMLACLWPQATALENGRALETCSLLTEFVLKTHSLVRNEITHFLSAEKFLFFPLRRGRREKTQCILACRNLYGIANSHLYMVPSSKAKWLIHFRGTPSAIVCTHVLHCPGLCLPWAEVTVVSHLLMYEQWMRVGLSKLLFSTKQ